MNALTVLKNPRVALARWLLNGLPRRQVRSFSGAQISRLTASLSSASNGINSDLDGALVILRARARTLCQNHEYGKRFLTLVANNVIGSVGPVLQVRAKLSDGTSMDKVANDAIETHYANWRRQCDIRGLMNGAQMDRVILRSAARDGEILIRLIRNRNLPYGLQLQVLEADRLYEGLNKSLSNGNRIRQGVEQDSYGRPVAYHVLKNHPGEAYNRGQMVEVERIPADDMIHVFLPERAEQVRGYTWMHAVLMRAHMLQGYEEAAVVAARVGAAKMGVFTRTMEAADGLPGIAQGTDGETGETGSNLHISAEAGEFFELPPGYDLKNWDPDYPHQNFESFMTQCLRGMASGLDVAAHNLTANMTDVNYSSARIAELSERDGWKVLQEWFIDQVSMRVFKEWLSVALLTNQITLPSGVSLPAVRLQKFTEAARFQARRWAWVDPSKEIEAARLAIEASLASRTSIVAEEGRDFDEMVEEIQQENATLTAAGLNTAIKPTPVNPAPQPDPAAAKGAQQHVIIEKGAISVDARSSHDIAVPASEVNIENVVNVPEREVHLEAKIDNHVETPAANVVMQHPKKTVETIERGEDREISRIVRTHET